VASPASLAVVRFSGFWMEHEPLKKLRHTKEQNYIKIEMFALGGH
jgi:hypothetical protein